MDKEKSFLFLGVLMGGLFGISGNILVSSFMKIMPDNSGITILLFFDSSLLIIFLLLSGLKFFKSS